MSGHVISIVGFTMCNGGKTRTKFQMALRHKSGLFPVQWQYKFRTLACEVLGGLFLYSCFIY